MFEGSQMYYGDTQTDANINGKGRIPNIHDFLDSNRDPFRLVGL